MINGLGLLGLSLINGHYFGKTGDYYYLFFQALCFTLGAYLTYKGFKNYGRK